MSELPSGPGQDAIASEIPVPPAARRRARIEALLEVILVSGFPTQLALGGLLMVLGLRPFGPDGQLSMPYLATLLTADTVALVAIVVWRLHASGERTRDLMLGASPWTREAALGLVLVPVLVGAVAALMAALRWAWPWLHSVEANPFEALARSPVNAALLGVLVVVSGGLKEEFQRAFVLHRFAQHLGGAHVGLIVYSLVFGAGHVIQGYDVGVATTLMGVAWGLLYLRRRSIVASAVNHAAFNAAQIVQFLVLGS